MTRRQTRTMLLPGLTAEHVDSGVAIRALKTRAAVGLHRLADVATKAIVGRREAEIALIEETEKRIETLLRERAPLLAARDNARAWVTASTSAHDYLTEQMIGAREGLSAPQGTIGNFVRGLLPGGDKPSWRRGALQGLPPYIVDAPRSQRGVWA